MARDFSQIACSIWNSRKFRSLKNDDPARLLYFYLHTNDAMNNVGCYVLKLGTVSEDLNWDTQKVRQAIDTLSTACLIGHDDDERIVRIEGFLTQFPTTNASHALACIRVMDTITDCYQKTLLINDLLEDKYAGNILRKQGVDTVSDTVSADCGHRDRDIDRDIDRDRERDSKTLRQRDVGESEWTMHFDEFWDEYPKRAGGNPKKPALAKYLTARKRGATAADILTGTRRYAASLGPKAGTQFVAQAATWLNQERWKDEYQPYSASDDRRYKPGTSPDDYAAVDRALADHARRIGMEPGDGPTGDDHDGITIDHDPGAGDSLAPGDRDRGDAADRAADIVREDVRHNDQAAGPANRDLRQDVRGTSGGPVGARSHPNGGPAVVRENAGASRREANGAAGTVAAENGAFQGQGGTPVPSEADDIQALYDTIATQSQQLRGTRGGQVGSGGQRSQPGGTGAPTPGVAAGGRTVDPERARQATIAYLKSRKWDVERFGPEPGRPGSRVPIEIYREVAVQMGVAD